MKFDISRKVWLPLGVTVGLLAVVWMVGTALAQGPDGERILSPAGGSPTGTFTYQGRLFDGTTPVDGAYDIEFSIWDSSSGGNEVGYSCLGCYTAIPINEGYFTLNIVTTNASLNEVFSGGPRWIEIEFTPTGTTDWQSTGRQGIAPTPYAWGLYPGTIVSGTIYGSSFGNAVLNINNTTPSYLPPANGIYVQSATSSAIRAESGGVGVYAESDQTYAVEARSYNQGTAGYFQSAGGYGVRVNTDGTDHWDHAGYFTADGGYGIFAQSTNNMAVRGEAGSVTGLTQPVGQWGVAGIGVDGGVYGSNDSGWAGYFVSQSGSGVYASVPAGHVGLNTNGTKPAVVWTEDGSRLLYTEESTEVWFTDYGFDTLSSGSVTVTIDPLFAQTVNLSEPYHVFVQAYGPSTLYVTNRTSTSFEVHAPDSAPDVEFSYRIVALRLGYEGQRMERAPWADADLDPNGTSTSRQGGGDQ